jgi:signal recognition particle receptor subunit beta
VFNVIVTGVPGVGKRAFVNAIRIPERHDSIGNLNTDGLFGRVRIAENMLMLTVSPANRPLQFLETLFSDGLAAVVILVDSTRPETFRETIEIIARHRTAHLPYIVVAVNGEQPGAWSPADLRIALRLEPGVALVPCETGSRESVKHVLTVLLARTLFTMGTYASAAD